MLCNTCLLNVRHPMRYLPRNNKIYLDTDGITEIEGAGYEDERFWLWTVLDPFDLVGAFKGKNMHRGFWESREGNGAAGRNTNEVEAVPAVVEDARRNAGKMG
jgi:hypothetical protein